MQRGEKLLLFCWILGVIILAVFFFNKIKAEACEGESISESPPIEQTESDEELFSRTHETDDIELSYEDAQLLMQIAAAEAGNQGPDGQRMIMSTVLNRVASPTWPGTVRAVIFQPGQFYTAGMATAPITADTHLALADIECGYVVPEIIAFETTRSNSLDKYFSYAFTFRDHQFYTTKQ